MIHLIKNKRAKKKEPKRYQVVEEDKDFHLVDSLLDDEKRKLATFYRNDDLKVKGKKCVAQRMAEKVAREMNEAWKQVEHLLPPQPEKEPEEKGEETEG